MDRFQKALNKIVKSCCPNCNNEKGCSSCDIEKTCNCTAKSWVDTLQELIDKHQQLKEENQKLKKLIKDKKISKKIVYEKSPTYNNVTFLMPKCPNCNITLLNEYKHCHNC